MYYSDTQNPDFRLIKRKTSGNDIFIVFIEVKYRKDERNGSPFEAVDYKKQMIIRKVSEYYLITNGYKLMPKIRYDVVGITEDNCFLAQVAAIQAVKKPYEISDLANFVA